MRIFRKYSRENRKPASSNYLVRFGESHWRLKELRSLWLGEPLKTPAVSAHLAESGRQEWPAIIIITINQGPVIGIEWQPSASCCIMLLGYIQAQTFWPDGWPRMALALAWQLPSGFSARERFRPASSGKVLSRIESMHRSVQIFNHNILSNIIAKTNKRCSKQKAANARMPAHQNSDNNLARRVLRRNTLFASE